MLYNNIHTISVQFHAQNYIQSAEFTVHENHYNIYRITTIIAVFSV